MPFTCRSCLLKLATLLGEERRRRVHILSFPEAFDHRPRTPSRLSTVAILLTEISSTTVVVAGKDGMWHEGMIGMAIPY